MRRRRFHPAKLALVPDLLVGKSTCGPDSHRAGLAGWNRLLQTIPPLAPIHSGPACAGYALVGGRGAATGVPQLRQNSAPGRRVAPQVGQGKLPAMAEF